MQSLALDYFALREERFSTDLDDLPLARVKWQWDAPPLAEALMQLQPPFQSIASNLEIALEEDPEEHLPEIDGIGIVEFPMLHEAWPSEGPSIQAQAELLRPRSVEWLSHYAAQQRDTPGELVAMKQVDQECEWMNLVAESHDPLKQEKKTDRMSQSMGRWPCRTDQECSSVTQHPGHEQVTRAPMLRNPADQLIHEEPKPLSKLWLGEGAVRSLDVTQLGFQKLPNIWSEVEEVDIARDDITLDVSEWLGRVLLVLAA